MKTKIWMLTGSLAMILMSQQQVKAGSKLVLQFNSDPVGIALGGSGTSAATVTFGAVRAYGGAVPAGVTKTVNGTTSWTLSTPIDVFLDKNGNNFTVPYTLTAQLSTPDAQNTWKFGGVTLNALPQTIPSSGTYNVNVPFTLTLTIPFSESAGTISNTIDFIAVAN